MVFEHLSCFCATRVSPICRLGDRAIRRLPTHSSFRGRSLSSSDVRYRLRVLTMFLFRYGLDTHMSTSSLHCLPLPLIAILQHRVSEFDLDPGACRGLDHALLERLVTINLQHTTKLLCGQTH